MTRVICVTFFIALSIGLITAYQKDCAVGPQYWCQSFQNAQDCGALRHCTDTVWRYDQDRTNVDSATSCQWCENILENTHKGILNLADNEDAIQSTLINACKLLPLTDVSLKCTSVVKSYGASVLSLMKHKRYNTLCQLMDVCATEQPKVEENTKATLAEEQDKMLCNVIVQATYELTNVQGKKRDEVQSFLLDDCQTLSDTELVNKCETLIHNHGHDIYGHVASNVELSKICDYVGNTMDKPILKAQPSTYCRLCQVVLSHAKSMLGDQQSEDKILSYIDEQVCSRLTGDAKKVCQDKIFNNGKAFLDDIQTGNSLLLPCAHFQLCVDDVISNKKSIKKSEMKEFMSKNFCDKLGSFAGACQALVKSDGTMVMKALAANVNGNELCQMFGLCPKTSELMTGSNLKDDPAKCQRCVKDFTRRKHIAERLVNHSAEFLHHLCGQLPNEADCVKAIDDSFKELLTFIRSMDPRDICVQLHMCDANSSEVAVISESDNILHEEILQFIKSDLCPKLGALTPLCLHITEKEGSSALIWADKTIDPHRVCEILDVCPSNSVFDQCTDKCQCCINKVDVYQLKFSKFLKTIVASTRNMCDFMPAEDVCTVFADLFEFNVNKALARLNSRSICQTLTFCSASPVVSTTEDQCQTCKTELKNRQKVFYTLVKDMTADLMNSCTDDECRTTVEDSQSKTLKQIEKLDVTQVCKHIGYCATSDSFEPSPIQLRLRNLVRQQKLTLDQRLAAHDICSEYGTLSTMCVHILTSSDSHRYSYVYKALMKGDTKHVDDDLREQLQTKPGAAICDACKNAVQSGKDFWINSLDVVHNVMLQACERCPKKDECKAFYDQRFERTKAYIQSIDADLFCQSVHLCASKSPSKVIIDEINQCTTCINYFDQRKENLEQGVNRLIPYLKDLCQRYNLKQCDDVLQGLQQNILPTIKNLQSKEICNQIGFCSLSDDNGAMSFDYYQKAIEDELEEKICDSLGPFTSLCKQVLHGNRKQVQTVKINDNIRDLLHLGEDKTSVNLLSAANQAECARDGCQCCINRIEGKKKCLTNLATQVFSVLINSCDYCPSKDSCRKYWSSEQDQCVSAIKAIDSKQICTKLGFCNVSSLCAKMNLFQDECERLLAQFTQSSSVIEQHLPHTSVVIVPTEDEKKTVDQVHDSNATCILCEYFMHMLTNYISQKSTEKEIEQSLEKICQQMPASLMGQCKEFVDNYAPVIVSTLIQDFDATTVCRRLNLCTKQMKVNLQHLTKADPAACGVCDYMATYVRFTLNRDPSGKSIPSALLYVCAHLSDQQKPQCQTLVQLFGSQMKELKLDLGDNFCQHLAICDTPKREPEIRRPTIVRVPLKKEETKQDKDDEYKRKIVKNLDETPQCIICHYVISYLDAALKNNKSEEAFEAALEKVCKILPTKERAQCNDFIKSYGPVLAELISEMADPDLVCRYLGICQVSTPVDVTTKKPMVIGGGTHDYNHLPVQDAPFTCTICQYLIGRMKHFVTLNQTEEEILASMKQSCDLFSVLDLKEKCQAFLESYGPYIIQMIASDVEPKVACQSMGICQKTSTEAASPATTSQKTDYTKCIFGMSYWCTSRQNAELCNAVEICETQVWSKKNKNIII